MGADAEIASFHPPAAKKELVAVRGAADKAADLER